LNSSGKEDRTVVLDDVMSAVYHSNFLFSREEQPWRITIKDRNNGDKKLNLVPVKIEYEGDELDEDDADDSGEGEAA
jgi:hypothetical protein